MPYFPPLFAKLVAWPFVGVSDREGLLMES